jgi:hypothetical protein
MVEGLGKELETLGNRFEKVLRSLVKYVSPKSPNPGNPSSCDKEA